MHFGARSEMLPEVQSGEQLERQWEPKQAAGEVEENLCCSVWPSWQELL